MIMHKRSNPYVPMPFGLTFWDRENCSWDITLYLGVILIARRTRTGEWFLPKPYWVRRLEKKWRGEK